MPDNFEKGWQWLRLEELKKDVAWWDIYKNSFPLTEQDSKKQLLVALEKGIATIGAYKLQGATVAITVFYTLPAHTWRFIFLNYFAVAPDARNQRLGHRLFNLLVNQPGCAALVWEVDDPCDADNEDEKKLRGRRLEFYKREGAQLLNSQFIQPPIDGLHCVPMRLMYRSLTEQINIHDYEREIIESIYLEKYRIVNDIAPKILQDLLSRIF